MIEQPIVLSMSSSNQPGKEDATRSMVFVLKK
jgi:hypothetical protein